MQWDTFLSDWSREQGTTLLQKVYDSLPNGGAVLFSKAFCEDKRGPLFTAMMNLVMLLETYGESFCKRIFQWLQEIGFGDCKLSARRGRNMSWVQGVK